MSERDTIIFTDLDGFTEHIMKDKQESAVCYRRWVSTMPLKVSQHN